MRTYNELLRNQILMQCKPLSNNKLLIATTFTMLELHYHFVCTKARVEHTSQGLLLSKTTEIVLQTTNIDEINQIQNMMITKWYAEAAATAKNMHDKNNDTLFTERSFFLSTMLAFTGNQNKASRAVALPKYLTTFALVNML